MDRERSVTAAGGVESSLGYKVVDYPHIHRRHVVAPAVARVKVMLDTMIAPGLKVGYVTMGVGDRRARCHRAARRRRATHRRPRSPRVTSRAIQRHRARRPRLRAPARICARTISACSTTRPTAARSSSSINGGVQPGAVRTVSGDDRQRARDRRERADGDPRARRSGVHHAEPDRTAGPGRTGCRNAARPSWRPRSALRRSGALGRSLPVQRRAEDGHPRRSARRTRTLDLHRSRPLAATAAGVDGAYRLLANLLSLGSPIPASLRRTTYASSSTRTSRTPRRCCSSPMMAINYAHLVMLAAQGIVSPRRRARARGKRSTASRRTRFARSSYDGTYEDLFFYIERLIVAGVRRRRRRAAAHGALAQRHRHDDVPDAPARAASSACWRPRSRCAARCSISPSAIARRSSRSTRTRSARSRRTVAHYLLAVIEQLERDAARLQAAYESTNRNPLGACAITGTGFPIDRAADVGAARLRRPDRQHLRQHRDGGLPAREHVGVGRPARPATAASSRTCCCGARRSSATCASATASCRAAASCRRSATRSRSSTRARSAARRSARRRRSSSPSHNTPFGDIVDTEDDLQPLVFAMFRDATRAVALVAAAMRRREFDAATARSARRRRLDDAHRARRYAGARSRPAVPAGARDRRALRRRRQRHAGVASSPRSSPTRPPTCSGSRRAIRKRISREILSPRHFVEIRKTFGGPSPYETRAPSRRLARALDADEQWLAAARERLSLAHASLVSASAAIESLIPHR